MPHFTTAKIYHRMRSLCFSITQLNAEQRTVASRTSTSRSHQTYPNSNQTQKNFSETESYPRIWQDCWNLSTTSFQTGSALPERGEGPDCKRQQLSKRAVSFRRAFLPGKWISYRNKLFTGSNRGRRKVWGAGGARGAGGRKGGNARWVFPSWPRCGDKSVTVRKIAL